MPGFSIPREAVKYHMGFLTALGYETFMRAIATYLFIALMWLLPAQVFAAESEVVDTGKVKAQLVSSHDVIRPGETFHVALRTVIDPEWHTYWANPGDSGEPVQIEWINSSVKTGDIIWPLPRPIPTGPIINYGFDDVAIFPVPMQFPLGAGFHGNEITIQADVYYLVCKDVCIPESTSLSLMLKLGESQIHDRWNDVINQAISDSPKPENIDAGIKKDGDSVVMNFANLPEGDFSKAYFFPWKQGVLDHSAKQAVTTTDEGIQIRTSASYGWEKGDPENVSGVISFQRNGEARGYQVEPAIGTLPDIGKIATPVTSSALSNPSSLAKIGFFGSIFGALLGGLILNIMPCVFPVISIKALSIAKSAHGEQKTIRREAWAYTIGVLATFLLLTIALLVIKAGGREIGWGFQLQDPRIVGFLALVLFAVGLNLLGVFEIGGSFQNTGQALTQKNGLSGSFFTGVLAVIVATPCTAPFMAPAIGFAFTQPAISTIAIFMALGLGFALPFLLIAYVPALSKMLPKPGNWMVTFKELLAFPMFVAVIWLLSVLYSQAGEFGLFRFMLALLAFAFAIWLWRKKTGAAKILGAVVMLGALAVPVGLHAKAVEIQSEAWSKERVAELRAEGRPVFVDFTAAWCVTCKVNERLVLDTDEIKEAFSETNTAFLVADWTNKNDAIAKELESFGRAGVPLYLLYPPGNNPVTPEILPQTLRKNMVKEKLAEVAN